MKTFLIAITIMIGFSSCAQSKFAAVNTYGFVRHSNRGTMPVDENNRPAASPLITHYYVYIETSGKLPVEWKKAWINNQAFDIAASIVQTPHVAGKQKSGNNDIELKAKPGNTLWQLELQEGEKEQRPAGKTVANANDILVKGLYKKQNIYVTVNNISELTSVIYP